MSALYIVVPLALLIVAAALWAFIWATRSGQFDDLTTPGVRVLFDEDTIPAGRSATDNGDNDANNSAPSTSCD